MKSDLESIVGEILEEIESVVQDLSTPLRYKSVQELNLRYKTDLEEALKVVRAGSEEEARLKRELHKKTLEMEKDKQDQLSRYAGTLKEREDAKAKSRALELQQKIAELEDARLKKRLTEEERAAKKRTRELENQKKLADIAYNTITNGMDKLYSQITSAATTYSGYVDKISTRLFGANESFSTISKTITEAFGSSAFFKMSTIFESITTAVSKGISYNIEERAAMNVLSQKVADTFEAFNENLLRLIRIQQDDSTRARLGMESLLTEFLNKNYQDTSYLDSISKSVSANLFEASSLRSTAQAAELEYVIQRYLGSLSSVGVSSTLIDSLSRGIGYLASGDISSLSSDDSLQQLLVASANRGGGASYGEMLTGNFDVRDAISLFTGFYSLIQEISETGKANNVVALNQYAKIFGMTVSDITATLNLSTKDLENISKDLKSYADMRQRVEEETTFAKLYSRTGGAIIGDNLYQNFIQNAGKGIGQTAAGYLSWELAGTMAGLLKGIETGISVKPFGIGTEINLTVGDIMKAATVSGATLSGLISMMSGINSIKGVDLAKLTSENRAASAQRGDLLDWYQKEKGTTLVVYTGDYSEGALAKSAGLATDRAVAQFSDESYDEEKRKAEQTQQRLLDIADNIEFIVQLLNESGVVVRGQVGTVSPVSHFTDETPPELSTLSVLIGG
jgi:hypothetical protein